MVCHLRDGEGFHLLVYSRQPDILVGGPVSWLAVSPPELSDAFAKSHLPLPA